MKVGETNVKAVLCGPLLMICQLSNRGEGFLGYVSSRCNGYLYAAIVWDFRWIGLASLLLMWTVDCVYRYGFRLAVDDDAMLCWRKEGEQSSSFVWVRFYDSVGRYSATTSSQRLAFRLEGWLVIGDWWLVTAVTRLNESWMALSASVCLYLYV
jgi:GNAT superfamily N-acetyltransferase